MFSGRLNSVFTGVLYDLCGPLSWEEGVRLAKELLCDPVSERYELEPRELSSRAWSRSRSDGYEADVRYHPQVTDATGASVLGASQELGISCLKRVASGTRLHFLGRALRKKEWKRIWSRFLMNPLVQRYELRDLKKN